MIDLTKTPEPAPAWGDAEDERLLAALPPELLVWIEVQLAARGDWVCSATRAKAVRRYLVALERITATTCPSVAEEAAAEALGLIHFPDPAATVPGPKAWARAWASHGKN